LDAAIDSMVRNIDDHEICNAGLGFLHNCCSGNISWDESKRRYFYNLRQHVTLILFFFKGSHVRSAEVVIEIMEKHFESLELVDLGINFFCMVDFEGEMATQFLKKGGLELLIKILHFPRPEEKDKEMLLDIQIQTLVILEPLVRNYGNIGR